MIGILRWLPISLALHSAALATTLLLPRERVLLPLFVDLTLSSSSDTPTVTAEGRGAGRESASPPRRSRAADERRPTRGVEGAATPLPAAPTPEPSWPAPPDPSIPAPTAATAPATSPTSAPAPDSSAEQPVTAARASSPAATTSSPAAAGPSAAAVPGGGAGSSAPPDAAPEMGASGVAVPGGGGGAAATGVPGSGGETLALAIPGDDAGPYAAYISLLRRRVQEVLTYPAAARRRGISGIVHLDISVEPTGRIADVLVVRSSSHELLDAAALDAVRALRQVPFPPGVRPRPVRVRLPVVFELR